MKTRLRKIPEMPLIQPELQQPLKAGEKSRALKGRPKKRPTGRAITKTNCPEQNPESLADVRRNKSKGGSNKNNAKLAKQLNQANK